MAIFQARTWLSRSFATLSSNSLRVCVVGSGPAGFCTAEKILKSYQEAQVDIIDRLPTPFGLVRSGVAPDHPETKIVINQFSRIAQHERCSLFGNVALGSSVSLSELRELYHVVVLAYGAENDRSLGISGENLKGVHSAREFVWWYNGHPDARNLDPDLKSTDTAVILGQGNVALDVAHYVRKVYLVGRRGPAQAACTAKELHEVLGIVPNNKGRVLSDDSGDPTLLEEGLYLCGWLKRGPTRIIATNLYCAEETVSSILEDLNKGVLVSPSTLPKQGREGLRQLLHGRNVRIVSFSDWEKIDSEEKRRGSTINKPREKLATWEELLQSASG